MAEDTNHQPSHDFHNWVRDTRVNYEGRDLLENTLQYIPLHELEDYWGAGKIVAILRSYDKPLPFDFKSIQSDYLRIFSTLVYTGTTRQLLGLVLSFNLDDTQWPRVDHPNNWPRYDDCSRAFEAVKKAQWTFFPYHFRASRLNDSQIDPNCILPISYLETITQENSSAIHKIKILDTYNDLVPSFKERYFALKDYDLKQSGNRYSTEMEALNMLRMSPSENLVTFYGSFRKDGHGFLILEYADAGDLSDFFTENFPPSSAMDISFFWASLLKALSGLDRIHQLMSVDSNMKSIIQGIHQDIRPANILLFKGASSSPYDFSPKIADFGLFSHARKTRSNSSEAKGNNKYGNQIFAAPEVGAIRRRKAKGLSLITPGADIFSFGAVLSTAAAWVIGGASLQHQYFEKRKSAHAKLKEFAGTDYEGCFHAGLQQFSAVRQMHDELKSHCHMHRDLLTPQILDIVECHMLQPESSGRKQASVLIDLFSNVASNEPTSPVTTISIRRRSALISTFTDDGASTPTSIESMKRINTFFDGKVLDSTVKDLVDKITSNLRDRDQFFFIDDSTSMQAYSSIVLEGFQALSSIAKRLDPNRVELAFASSAKFVYRARDTKKLVKLLKKHEFRHDPTMMEKSLSELIEHQIIKKLPVRKMGFNINLISRKRVSVYIFTDGNWGNDPNGACRVERPVKDLIDEVQRRKLSRHQVTLHFVRFGDSAQGSRHLDFLDRFGEEFDCDIVDVKHISSDVVSIFKGPLSHQNDRLEEVNLKWRK